MKKKVLIKKEVEVDLKWLVVKANIRYWEDAIVNGVEDVDGTLIPCKNHGLWCPKIDIDSGIILNWEKGVTADIHYKVCDEGSYYIQDIDGNVVSSIQEDYVPPIMCPGGDGWGDYIIMKVNENGQISNWNPIFTCFDNLEDLDN